MAVHRKPEDKLLCPDCGSGFGRDSSLKRHQNTPGSCQKKKQAKLLDTSHKGLMAGSNHNFDGGSITSFHESDISIDNGLPHDPQYNPRLQPRGGIMPRNHPASSRPLHSPNNNHLQYDMAPGYYPSQSSNQNHPARNPHRGASPQTQAAGWQGIDPALWPTDINYRDSLGEFLNFDAEGG